MSDDYKDYIKKQINDIAREIKRIRNLSPGSETHNSEYHLLKDLLELQTLIQKTYPDKKLIPKILTIEEVNKQYQYSQGYYINQTIRKIAAALNILLEVDEKPISQSPTIHLSQNQILTNVSMQNFEQLHSNVNLLQMEQNTKDEIRKLIREFEKTVEDEPQNPKKWREILGKISNLSIDAGILVYRFAKDSRILDSLLSG